MSDMHQDNPQRPEEPIRAESKPQGARRSRRWIKGAVIGLAAAVAAVVLLANSLFMVGEAEQAVVNRLGVINKVIVNYDNTFVDEHPELMNTENAPLQGVTVARESGLYFKIPFVETVQKYPSWLFTYSSGTEMVNTADKKQYNITIFAQWRVANPALFHITHRSQDKASQYLDNLICPVVIQNINRLQATDFISNKDVLNESLSEALGAINDTVAAGGLEVVDIQIHRTSLPPANLQSTYDRMMANRAKVAQQLRSEGEEQYQMQVSDADREARVLTADAIEESARIRGEGDAQALEIYSNSYSADPEFYGYWRSLQALQASLKDGATLVLDPSHPLWADLLKMTQDAPAAP